MKTTPMMDLARLETFPDIEAFYNAHPAARHSVESDYGCWWKDDGGGNWRVTYVHDTGHVYAIGSGSTSSRSVRVGGEEVAVITPGESHGPVVILGQLPTFTKEREAQVKSERLEAWKASGYSRALSLGVYSSEPPEIAAALEGWAQKCGEQGSLAWALAQIRRAA